MKIRLYYILAFILLFIGLSSCEDERIYDPSFIGEGEATIAAEITFTPLQAALSRAVEGGTEGNAHKVLNNIHLVFYKENGEFAYHFPFENPDVSPSKDKPSDKPGDGEHRAEEETLKSSLHIPMVSFGKYKIYVLANIPSGILTDDLLSSADNLKKITLEWNDADISANNQMFGYISENNTSNGFEAPVITINKAQVSLHGWIKRAASKVTVAFDGTNLKPGVEIFIKSIEIKDIPKYCYLGANNPAEPEKEIELINKGQSIIFDNGKVGTGEGGTTTYDKNWIGYVSKDHPVNGYDQDIVKDASLTTDEKLEALHSERMKALYLYENLQGMGVDNTPSDKRQQVNENHVNNGIVSYPNGVDPSDIAWKDAKKYGSYIEVKAYYRSHNEKEGEGDIVYRFMLGKDTHLDYNTERNYHYKLTLKFKGWANDVDWHIDYTKEPPEILRFKQPFYISYLYGQVAMVPMEFETAEDVKITGIKATILENNWAPDGAGNAYSSTNQPNNSTDYTKYYFYVSSMVNPSLYQYNGFLSLKKPKNLLVVPGDFPLSAESNKSHYINNSFGYREYTESEAQISSIPLYQAMAEDKLYVEREGKTYYVKMPVWTRARLLITTTGYTGNNPYNAYYRKAKVHVEISLSNGKILKSDETDLTNLGEKDITIKQVRRLVNPKGIWRSKDKHDDFHVVLKVLADDADTNFTDLKSEGGWRAYVIRDTDADEITGDGGFISLKGAEGTTTAKYTFEFGGKVMTRTSIEGNNSLMDFTVKFDGPNPGKPRYAVIRVEYNYNSCYHLIFVRQGYEADDTFGDGNKWCTANMVDQTKEASNPLDEGSLFRFGNWVGIKAESNKNHKDNWVKITPNDFEGNAGTNLSLTDGKKADWPSNNTGVLKSWNPQNSSEAFKNPGKGYRFANLADYSKLVPKNLYDEDEVANFHIKTGNGVLYGDGATETASTIEEAFGYFADGKHESYGMRGCFVYDIRTGKNLFFPIGRSGYGHRKNKTNGLYGVLRYSSNNRWGYFNAVNSSSYAHGVFDAPLFLDIFRSPGAIYWYQSGYGSEEVAWDINYATFDFKSITNSNVYSSDNGGSDACFIRCISTE